MNSQNIKNTSSSSALEDRASINLLQKTEPLMLQLLPIALMTQLTTMTL